MPDPVRQPTSSQVNFSVAVNGTSTNGNLERCLRNLDDGVQVKPATVEFIGSRLCDAKKPEDAAALYIKALEKDVNISPKNIEYTGSKLSDGNPPDADKLQWASGLYYVALIKKIEINNKRIEHVGGKLCDAKKPEETVILYLKALERNIQIDPKRIEYVGGKLCDGEPPDIEKLELAISLYSSALDKAIKIDSKRIEYVGGKLHEVERLENIIPFYKKALENNIQIGFGRIEYISKKLCYAKPLEVAALYNEALNKDIKIGNEYIQTVCDVLENNHLDQAAALYQKALEKDIQINPGRIQWILSKLMDAEKTDEGEALYKIAIEKKILDVPTPEIIAEPSEPDLIAEAEKLFNDGDFEGAADLYVQELRKGVQVDPEWIEATGDALCDIKYNPKSAAILYEVALEKNEEKLHPAKVSYVLSRLCDSNDFEDATSLLVEALEQRVPVLARVIQYTCSDIANAEKGADPGLAADLYMKALEILGESEIREIKPGSIGFVGRALCLKFKNDGLPEGLEKAASLYHAALDKGIKMNNASIQYLGSELCNEVSVEEGARLYEKALEKGVENINPGNIRYAIDAFCNNRKIKEAASLYDTARKNSLRVHTNNISAILKHLGE